jgi:hypothetical protein
MDKKAKNILFKTYWGSDGWRPVRETEPQDFAYAKAHGLMFDPVSIGHDQCIIEILDMVERIPAAKAATAFVASLSTRRLDWRSGVASYHHAGQIAALNHTPVVSGRGDLPDDTVTTTRYVCDRCHNVDPGLRIDDDDYNDVDVNVLNFERLKWGGVRHGQLTYTWFDLQQLLRADIPDPTEEDVAILQAILRVIDSSQAGDYAGTLEKRLAGVVKSSKYERRVIIDVLAHLGVLKPASLERSVDNRSDWSAGAALWRGEDKSDHENVHKNFGKWLRG